MIGFDYFRRKLKLKSTDLAKLSGETDCQIYHMMSGPAPETHCRSLANISDALGMPIDVLLWDFDDAELASGDRGVFLSAKTIESNPLEIYRRINNLSYAQMAQILGMSRQNVHRVAKNGFARQRHIEKLAAGEGISFGNFVEKYSISEWAILPDDDLCRAPISNMRNVKREDKETESQRRKLVTKKSIAAKEIIQKNSKDFGGTMRPADVTAMAGISLNTYYKYKNELQRSAPQ